jgi:hypothetical protein
MLYFLDPIGIYCLNMVISKKYIPQNLATLRPFFHKIVLYEPVLDFVLLTSGKIWPIFF